MPQGNLPPAPWALCLPPSPTVCSHKGEPERLSGPPSAVPRKEGGCCCAAQWGWDCALPEALFHQGHHAQCP